MVLLVTIAIALPACTTTQLQKQYVSFNDCFHQQKIIAGTGGAIVLGVFTAVLAGGGKKGAVVGAAGAVVGAIIGQRIAWESCLKAFPPHTQTTNVQPPPVQALATKGGPGAPTPYLAIQSVTPQPLVFGRDLEVSAQYMFVSDKPGARDVKVRVSRNLLFTAPDGSRQEIASSSEDTIQQGTSRTTFAIPTPSTVDAPELMQTRDWAIKCVVEVDGMRQELTVPLQVADAAQATPAQPPQQALPLPQQVAPQSYPPPAEVVHILPGTRLVSAPNSKRVVERTKLKTTAQVLQRVVISGVVWLEVEVPDGKRAWMHGGHP